MGIRQLIKRRPIIFDGAMGTMIQNSGFPVGKIPEIFNFKHPEVVKKIYQQYLSAGSDVISTNTFGSNRFKTANCGFSVAEIISKGVILAKEAVSEHVDSCRGDKDCEKYVALSLGPIGKLMAPTGELQFEEACDLYREQIIPGIEAGADLILIETLSDLYELKAAIITARELTDMPLFATVTFQEDGRMLMGSDPVTAVTMLQDLGADAIGINCSLGPEQMLPIVEEMVAHCRLPIMVQPNAGMPRIKNGKTVYDVDAKKFVAVMEQIMRLGASIVGGCCGTTPEYIKALSDCAKSIDYVDPDMRQNPCKTALCSATKTVIIDDRVCVIGERINPTGKKPLKEALMSDNFGLIEKEAILQVDAGANVLDVNVGLPGIDEKRAMLKAIERISSVTDAPLQIDSADPEVIEAAARHYNGCPIINSVNGKREVMDAIFPIVKKYGTSVIALTLDENGLPKNAEERVQIAERILKEAAKYGIGKERIIVDCLTLTVSAQQNAGIDTLRAMRMIKDRFDVRTTLGVSNISYGLPHRSILNQTFLSMALTEGLDAPITDPLVSEYMDTIRAFETLTAKDSGSKDYIEFYGKQTGKNMHPEKNDSEMEKKTDIVSLKVDELADIIVNGYRDKSAAATKELLKYKSALDIVETIIIPSLSIVGREYENGEKFLPQLVQSADAVKPAFDVIRQRLTEEGRTINYGKIILATVKGDIHDIGKGIVKVLLENYGYEVLDLGKDTDIQAIVDTASSESVKLVGLSALMTTTVVNMEATINALRKSGLDCKIAVGGAVLNPEYAKEIGADFYCGDAMDGVRVANSIFRGANKNTQEAKE
ncbi:MAG TPA: homocysteine S-methyltransferase family protein [Anaerovoracaceae bacterium]|nr:homocysteine S-methyltransferase family protein [Anaerovoracaceae bacterium]